MVGATVFETFVIGFAVSVAASSASIYYKQGHITHSHQYTSIIQSKYVHQSLLNLQVLTN